MKSPKLPWEKLEKLKKPHKYGIFFGTLLVIGAAYFFLLYQPQSLEMTDLNDKIEGLETRIIQYKRDAGRLDKVRRELEKVELEFEVSKRFLPEKKDVDDLLRSISDNGAQSGLNVILFQPQLRDELKDFYAEINFEMKVEGPYVNVATFFFKIGQMDRIVTINDITLGTPKLIEGDMVLTASCKGRTFRFLTPEEIKAQEEAQKAATKKGK